MCRFVWYENVVIIVRTGVVECFTDDEQDLEDNALSIWVHLFSFLYLCTSYAWAFNEYFVLVYNVVL